MIDFESLNIDKLVLHKIGNKMRDEGVQISQELHPLDDSNIKEIMLRFFLNPFKKERVYNFSHESKLELNEVYYFVRNVFKDQDYFYEESINILKHLYETSNHPNIKSGEFYMSYFKNYSTKDKNFDAIGLFKTENKDIYLKVNQNRNNFNISYDRGINTEKLDKGCLIINDGMNNGYKVLVVDTAASSQNKEAQYWKKGFLNLKELENDSFNTGTFIKICSSFSANVVENSIDSTDSNINNIPLKFKNSAYKYLEENSKCSLDDFVHQVFDNDNLGNEFKDYKKRYEETYNITPIEVFDVSPTIVNKLKNRFISNIKLDTGFDIKLTNGKFLEKGFDEEKGMSYYKLYFHNEK
ncbi:nucleoid-associated protein [Paenibacillus alvei]|uniref:nucleoid-associated protein n=1 Tax=Paenibacillus alvei TaxID=44250 RepID=UPI00227E749D|nr:nucleoid-associated protein [Paenibacillus alvei]MCY7483720.1 nucleoid-associated protein [Paenibacillus alvei]